jgi:hypothetical protein
MSGNHPGSQLVSSSRSKADRGEAMQGKGISISIEHTGSS